MLPIHVTHSPLVGPIERISQVCGGASKGCLVRGAATKSCPTPTRENRHDNAVGAVEYIISARLTGLTGSTTSDIAMQPP